MDGRIFFIDKGAHVLVRNLEGTTVSFDDIEQFNRYCSKKLDLSGEYYIDYEPDKKVLYKSVKGNFEPLKNLWEGPVSQFEAVIEDVESMRKKLDDPYFGLEMEEARKYKIGWLKQSTYGLITSRMPVWKQTKWKEYIALYEKHADGQDLTPLEELTFDAFPPGGLSHEQCYNNCTAAFRWLIECVSAHNHRESEITKDRSIESIKAAKAPDYPEWKESETQNG